MPIRKALVALLLLSALFCLASAGTAGAAPQRGNRPSAALVASSESRLGPEGTDGISPLGLAALVAAGWVPALVLLARRRRQNRSTEE